MGLTALLLTSAVYVAAPPNSVEQVYEQGTYQRDIPGHDYEVGNAGTESRRVERSAPSSARLPPAGSGGAVAEVLLWVVLAIVGFAFLVLLVQFVREARSGRRRRPGEESLVVSQPVEAPAPIRRATPPPAHEQIAASGDFTAAVRAVLHAALFEVERSREDPSTTSREILRALRGTVPEPARQALRTMVTMAERGHFAGNALTREDYGEAVAALARWRSGRP